MIAPTRWKLRLFQDISQKLAEKKDRESLFINLPIFLLKLLRDERFEVELSV